MHVIVSLMMVGQFENQMKVLSSFKE